MKTYYEIWLDRKVHTLDIDCTGQINFIGTSFESNQTARRAIQKIFDNKYYNN